MSKDTLEKIRKAERDAARLVADAEERAKAMKADAVRAGEERCQATEKTVSGELAGMLEQIREKIAEMTERVMEETKAEAEEVAARARLNRKSAEKIVIGGLDAKSR